MPLHANGNAPLRRLVAALVKLVRLEVLAIRFVGAAEPVPEDKIAAVVTHVVGVVEVVRAATVHAGQQVPRREWPGEQERGVSVDRLPELEARIPAHDGARAAENERTRHRRQCIAEFLDGVRVLDCDAYRVTKLVMLLVPPAVAASRVQRAVRPYTKRSRVC